MDCLDGLRRSHDFLLRDEDVVLINRKEQEVCWFSYAGGMINLALADVFRSAGFGSVTAGDFWIRVSGTSDAHRIIEVVTSRGVDSIRDLFQIGDEFLKNLKFSECLPTELAHAVLRDRLLDSGEIHEFLRRKVRVITR